MSSSIVLPTGDPSILGFVPERFEPLHRRIQQFVADGQHAGISLLLARNGDIADIFASAFGIGNWAIQCHVTQSFGSIR